MGTSQPTGLKCPPLQKMGTSQPTGLKCPPLEKMGTDRSRVSTPSENGDIPQVSSVHPFRKVGHPTGLECPPLLKWRHPTRQVSSIHPFRKVGHPTGLEYPSLQKMGTSQPTGLGGLVVKIYCTTTTTSESDLPSRLSILIFV